MSAGVAPHAAFVDVTALVQVERARVGERSQPPVADELLVDAAEPAAVGRVHGHAERRRLAVHRAAGRDDDIGERDEALRVHGAIRDDHGRQVEAADVLALLLRPRQHERVDAVVPAEVVERAREQRVRVPVVERDVRRWAEDDEDALPVDVPGVEHALVRLEVREVVLLLEARVAEELRRLGAVLLQPLGRDRLGDDDARGGAAAELVLQPGPLVVEGRGAGDPEPPRCDRQLVRAVGERDVELPVLRPAMERAEPRRERLGLAEPRPPAVPPEHVRLHTVQLEQLQRLRVVARGDLDLVAARAEDPDQRPEDQNMG